MDENTKDVKQNMDNPMYVAALDLLNKREFSVIPVGRDKKPLISWTEYQRRLPGEEEIEEWWTRWPDANIGVVTGKVSNLVVVDADGNTGIAWMWANLPPSSVYVETSKGCHGYYRHPGGDVSNRVRLAPEVDIRGDGGYVVAPPSIHEAGHEYKFHFTEGLRAFDDMPVYEPAVVAPSATALGVLPDLSGVKTLTSLAPVAKGQRNNTLAELAGGWFAKGFDLDSSHLMGLGWNSRLPQPLPEDEVHATVVSVFKKDMRDHPERHTAPVVELVKPAQVASVHTGTALTPELLHPGGLIGQLMAYIAAASAVSHHVFALAGAIAVIGTLIGQKFQTETGLRTNFYCIALGYSGAGKDSPQSAIPQVLNRSRAALCLGGDALTSDAALLRHLAVESQARALFMLDELGLLLQALKRPNSHAADIPATLMKLFTSADRGYSRRYSDPKNNIDIKWHHLSLYGASTPDRFWDSLTRSEATDGFLARCLVFESRHDVEQPKRRTDTTVPAELLDAVNDLHDIQTPLAGTGNLCMVPCPVMVPKTPTAEKQFTQWADGYHELRNRHLRDDEGLSSIYGRAAEHAHKLALVHAVSLHGAAVTSVDKNSVTWACELTDALIGGMVRQITENLADTEFHKLTQRAIKIIGAECGRRNAGCPRHRVATGLRGVTPKVFNDVLAALKERGQIHEEMYKPKAGPSALRFYLSKPVEDEEDTKTQNNTKGTPDMSLSPTMPVS